MTELTCPVCGLEQAFPEPRAWEKCPRCGWYDDPVQYDQPDSATGDNGPMTLKQAGLAWKSGKRVDEWRQANIDRLMAMSIAIDPHNANANEPDVFASPDADLDPESDTGEPEGWN